MSLSLRGRMSLSLSLRDSYESDRQYAFENVFEKSILSIILSQ